MSASALVKTLAANENLLRQLTAYLLGMTDTDLRELTIVLPTNRLGTLLLASLAEGKGRYFIPPRVLTLETWVSITASSRPDKRPVLDDQGARMLMSTVLIKSGYGYLKRGHESELIRIHSELIDTGLDPHEAFAQLRLALEAEEFRDESHTHPMLRRIDEMEQALVSFNATLAKLGLETGAIAQAADTKYIQELFATTPAPASVQLIFAGFTSLKPAVELLLKQLIENRQAEFWINQCPQFFKAISPLAQLVNAFASFAATQSTPPPEHHCAASCGTIYYTPCSTRLEEVRQALTSCAEALNMGIPASRIAILVSQEADYVDLLQTLSDEAKFPVNIALARGLHLFPIGSWLTLLATALNKRRVLDVVYLIQHPMTMSWLAAESAFSLSQIAATTLGWTEQFNTQELNATCDSSFFNLLAEKLPPLKPIAELWIEIEKTQGKTNVAASHYQFILQNIVERLKRVLADTPQFDDCYQACRQHLEQCALLAQTLELKQSFGETIAELQQALRGIEIRTIGEPLHGVQVLSLAESRGMPFSHVALIGCNEGLFPKSMPQDELLDDYCKRLLGLPGWQALEAREDVTFGLLRAQVSSLHLFYATERLGDLLTPSRYIEMLHAKKEIRLLPPVNLRQNSETYSSESLDSPCIATIHADVAQSKLRYMSASSLEALIHCPYQFLLRSFRVQSVALPVYWTDERDEGEWLHRVFEETLTLLQQNPTLLKDPPQLLATMLEFNCKHGPRNVSQTALHQHLQHHAYPKFIDFLQMITTPHGPQALSKGERELRFRSGGQGSHFAEINIENLPVQLQGKLDSIDHLGNVALILDYKRKSLPIKQDTSRGISPQLSFYALAIAHSAGQHQTAVENIITAYWSMIKGELQVSAIGSEARSTAVKLGLASPRKSRSKSLEETVEAMLGFWSWRLRELASNNQEYHFIPDSSDCKLCEYSGVCRKQEAPWQDYFQRNRKLAQHLASITSSDSEDEDE